MATKKHDRQTVLDAINGEGFWGPRDGKLTHSLGNVMTIAARLDVHRTTIYQYAKDWASVADAIKEGRELRKDLVEDKMFRRIMEGSDVMMIFFAKTQMKDRGYVERQEITASNLNIDLSILTDKQLERIRNGEDPAIVATTG
jgi:hypothetical protein